MPKIAKRKSTPGIPKKSGGAATANAVAKAALKTGRAGDARGGHPSNPKKG